MSKTLVHFEFKVGGRSKEKKRGGREGDSKETDSPHKTPKECSPTNISVLAH